MYRKPTRDHDLSKAVIKFGINDLIKYPNCLKRIEVSGQLDLGRYKRTIGKVPNYGAPRTSSRPVSAISRLNPSQNFTPPFKGQNDVVELTLDISPCKRYRFSLKFIGQNGATLGEVVGIQMKSLDQMHNIVLPPLMKVLRLHQTATILSIDLQQNSPIPASCVITYIQAVDKQLEKIKVR